MCSHNRQADTLRMSYCRDMEGWNGQNMANRCASRVLSISSIAINKCVCVDHNLRLPQCRQEGEEVYKLNGSHGAVDLVLVGHRVPPLTPHYDNISIIEMSVCLRFGLCHKLRRNPFRSRWKYSLKGDPVHVLFVSPNIHLVCRVVVCLMDFLLPLLLSCCGFDTLWITNKILWLIHCHKSKIGHYILTEIAVNFRSIGAVDIEYSTCGHAEGMCSGYRVNQRASGLNELFHRKNGNKSSIWRISNNCVTRDMDTK